MPTYQYACTVCDQRLEAVQSFTDAPLAECPACSGRLRKVFSAVGVVFKGSGFYKNDSRDAPKKGGAPKAEPAVAGASGSGSGSSSEGAGSSGGSSSGSDGSGGSGPAKAAPAKAAPAPSTSAPTSKSA